LSRPSSSQCCARQSTCSGKTTASSRSIGRACSPSRDHQIIALEEEVAFLKSNFKEPADFIAGILEASAKGHTESVAFLLAKDKSLVAKKDEIDQF
jgi:hypothetical protein